MLWTTGFVTILFVAGVDSIYGNGYFFQTFIAVIVMIFCCYKLISEKEFEVLSLYKWFNKVIIDSNEYRQIRKSKYLSQEFDS